MSLQAPFPWFGGKSRVAPVVWERFGNVPNYVEPFAGSLAVLLCRPHEPGIETVNDLDGFIANFWRAVQSEPDAVAHYADWPVNECVPTGTLIATPNGSIPVEAIKPGMVVLGERDGRVVPTIVEATKCNQASEFYGIGPLWLTGNHPVWTAEEGYRQARELRAGMRIAKLDWSANVTDLVMLYSPHEDAHVEDLQPQRSTHRGGALHRRDLPWEATLQRTHLSRHYGRQDTSRQLDTVTDCRWGEAGLCDHRGWAGRRLAGGGALLDSAISANWPASQPYRWWRRRTGLCADARTARQMVTDEAGRPVRAGENSGHARQEAHARSCSQNPTGQHGAGDAGDDASQALGLSQREAYDGGIRCLGCCQDGQAPQRGAQGQDCGCDQEPQASDLPGNGRNLLFDHRCCTVSRGERSVRQPGHPQGMSLQELSLAVPVAVYNFQTTTGNYFANNILVHNCDLHARHAWLVGQRETLTARLEGDPDYYDAKIAGWWLWGICAWIGSGWCSGEGPWQVVDGQLVHLGDAGRGINRKRDGSTCAAWSAHLSAMMRELADRLRRVRVCSGDWTRVCGPSPTTKLGLTAIFLDPPYANEVRTTGLYGVDDGSVAARVRAWAIANGNNPQLRIALCGYDNEHTAHMPDGWTAYHWTARGGYGSQGNGMGRENRARECIWFSPHCLNPERQPTLFDALEVAS